MESSNTAIRLDGVADSQSNKTVLSPLTPSYESWDQRGLSFDAFSWCPPDPTYAASTLLDGSACDYFPLGKGSASVYQNPATNVLQWATPGAPLTAMGGGPDPWSAETDAEACDLFSPVGNPDAVGSRTSHQLQAVTEPPVLGPSTHTKRLSQSEESSTTLSPVPSADDVPTDKSKRRKIQARARKHSIQLRTATRKPRKESTPTTIASPISPTDNNNNNNNKRSPPTEEDDLTSEERRARRNHNIVEKQYRNRLNAQFERLLAVLPLDQGRAGAGAAPDQAMGGGGGGNNGGNGGGGDEKRMSKAEVLDLATRRIRMLEADRERLLRERKELLRSIEVMMAGTLVARPGVGVAVRRN